MEIGSIAPDKRFGLPIDRFCGPVRHVRIATASDGTVRPAIIGGGFAAIEAEMVVRLARPLVAADGAPDASEVPDFIGSVHIGSEIAGSSIREIITLGPIGAICDHGNCLEVVVGAALERSVLVGTAGFDVSVWIDGEKVGVGTPAALPGGISGALSFLFKNLADRGIDLASGTWISTGALTGVHPILPDQAAVVRFGSYGELHLSPALGG